MTTFPNWYILGRAIPWCTPADDLWRIWYFGTADWQDEHGSACGWDLDGYPFDPHPF